VQGRQSVKKQIQTRRKLQGKYPAAYPRLIPAGVESGSHHKHKGEGEKREEVSHGFNFNGIDCFKN
jgi:hypothetical protein